MSSTTKTESFRLLKSFEGGYVNHPKDPGGATMKGVTTAVYNSYRKSKGLALQDVRKITDAEWDAITTASYWDKVKGDDLPVGLDMAAMDYGYNSGPARAIKDLQRTLGVGVDGKVGPETIVAAERAMALAPQGTIEAYCQRRLAFCKSLKTWKTFGKGWQRRIMGDKLDAQVTVTKGKAKACDVGIVDYAVRAALEADPKTGAMAPIATAMLPTAIGKKDGEEAGKANESQQAPSKTSQGIAHIAAGGLAAVAAAKPVIDQVQQAIMPHAGIFPKVAHLVEGAAACAAIGMAIFGYFAVKGAIKERADA